MEISNALKAEFYEKSSALTDFDYLCALDSNGAPLGAISKSQIISIIQTAINQQS